ncbi:hypothetical protein CHARACLAT_006174 [Characodon lateralis]|uniref:Uncharacterized protein n=1 Tax=Characodon lateralis TaxID=208331 RepID=A0ABU7CLE7_9TELE|nr:hypothetical protein [Characodon lateralis]
MLPQLCGWWQQLRDMNMVALPRNVSLQVCLSSSSVSLPFLFYVYSLFSVSLSGIVLPYNQAPPPKKIPHRTPPFSTPFLNVCTTMFELFSEKEQMSRNCFKKLKAVLFSFFSSCIFF